jgi:hypothetical protein
MAITPNRWGAVGCDMETILVPIAVAVISGPIVVLLQRLRRENAEQHAEGRILLRNVANKVDKVTSKLDEHIGWHKGKE